MKLAGASPRLESGWLPQGVDFECSVFRMAESPSGLWQSP